MDIVMPAASSPLEHLVALCQQGMPWRICLWDWAGICASQPELALDFDHYQVHRNPFCEYAKSTPAGLRRCLRCRQAAGFEAMKRGPFLGSCHLGVSEMVHPIRMGEQVLGILFGGQMRAVNAPPPTAKALGRRVAAMGLDARRLAALRRGLPRAGALAEAELRARLELIARFIIAQLKSDPGQSLSGKPARPPVQQEIPSMRGRSRRSWLAKSGIEIARMEYHKPLSSSRVAGRLGVSLSVFCRCFREHSGRSFKDYLQETRVKAASRLLIESESSIGYIAAETGFSEANFFSRVFKRRSGLSPAQFREKHWKIKNSK